MNETGNPSVTGGPEQVLLGPGDSGGTRRKQGELRIIHESVEKLVEIAEAKNVKVTFFFDQE